MQYTYEEIAIYQNRKGNVDYLARQMETGILAIRKTVDAQLFPIYNELKKISHPNLMRVFDAEIQNEQCIVYEEYICGETLEEFLQREGKQDCKTVISYLDMLCAAAEQLHKKQIIHRDISPDNVILTPEGGLKLCDFDIARIYKEHHARDTFVLGTEGYAAPEQFGYEQTDERADIYAIGALANLLLTGDVNTPYRRWGRLKWLIGKAMSFNKKERFNSVHQMRQSLGLDIEDNEQEKCSMMRYVPGWRTQKLWKQMIASSVYPALFYIELTALFEGRLDWAALFFYGALPWIFFLDLFHVSKRVLKLGANQSWFRIVVGLAIQFWGFYMH